VAFLSQNYTYKNATQDLAHTHKLSFRCIYLPATTSAPPCVCSACLRQRFLGSTPKTSSRQRSNTTLRNPDCASGAPVLGAGLFATGVAATADAEAIGFRSGRIEVRHRCGKEWVRFRHWGDGKGLARRLMKAGGSGHAARRALWWLLKLKDAPMAIWDISAFHWKIITDPGHESSLPDDGGVHKTNIPRWTHRHCNSPPPRVAYVAASAPRGNAVM